MCTQIFAKDFTKEWVEYPFNPIALASIDIAKESIFTLTESERESEKDQRTSEGDQRKFSNIKENFAFALV